MLVSLSHYQHSGHGAPEHLVSSVQAAAPHQTLHSEHSGPGEKGGGLHLDHGPHLVLSHCAPLLTNARHVSHTQHANNVGGLKSLLTQYDLRSSLVISPSSMSWKVAGSPALDCCNITARSVRTVCFVRACRGKRNSRSETHNDF